MGQVHIVPVGVLEAEALIPQGIQLGGAVVPHLGEAGALVAEAPLVKYLDQQFPGGVVVHRFALPDGVGVKDGDVLAVVHRGLLPQVDVIGQGLAVLPAVEPPHPLEAGGGDLLHRLADLDLGLPAAVGPLHRRQLVHPAEHRLRLAGDQVLPHPEGVQLGPLEQQVPDDVLVQGVAGHDLHVLVPGGIQQLPGLFGEIGQVPAVDAHPLGPEAPGHHHFIKDPDGVGDAGTEGVVGVDEEGAVVRVGLGVGPEGVVLGGEHLDPAVGHRPQGGDAELPVGDGVGRPGAAGDVGGPCPQDSGVVPLGPAGAELHHRPIPRCPDDAAGLGGHQRLKVDGGQQHRFHQLGLEEGPPHRQHRLVGEDGGTLRHPPHIAGEAEVLQVPEELFPKTASAAEVVQVLLGEPQVLQVLHHLFQPGADGEAPGVGDAAEEQVKDHVAVPRPAFQIAVCHCKFVEIRQHGQVALLIEPLFHRCLAPLRIVCFLPPR